MLQEAKCKMKFIRQSPYKVRFVLDAVRGKKIDQALDFLEFSNKHWRQGKKLLIHCNQGESRAPSLALLFVAT